MEALTVFIIFLILTFLGMPVAISLGASTMVFAMLLDVPLTVVALLLHSLHTPALTALPSFPSPCSFWLVT